MLALSRVFFHRIMDGRFVSDQNFVDMLVKLLEFLKSAWKTWKSFEESTRAFLFIVRNSFTRLRAQRHLESFYPATVYIYKCDLLVSFISHTSCGMTLTKRSHLYMYGVHGSKVSKCLQAVIRRIHDASYLRVLHMILFKTFKQRSVFFVFFT